MPQAIKRSLPLGHLRTLIEDTSSVNDEKRTVELTWSTGFKGMRSGWDGKYFEELSMDPQHVDMTRLQSGAPLLANHDSWSLDSVVGVVERAWIENGVGKAEVRFAKTPQAEDIYQNVKDKILRNVSVGYQVRKYEDVTIKGDTVPTYRAVNWQPHEISIVPIGFDPKAQVRENEIINEVEILNQHLPEVEPSKENTMPNVLTEEQKRALELEKQQAVQAEKTRQSDIRSAVRSAKFEETFADELINKDITADQARKIILEKLAAKQPEPINPTVRVDLGTDEKDKKRDAVENALLHRIMPDAFSLSDAGRDVRGMDLIRMGALLTNNPYGSDADIAKRTMSTSDLPLILANVAEKSVQKSYETTPSTFEEWVNQRTLRNYKQAHQLKVGDFPALEERNEEGEFTEGYFSEGEELVQLKKFGKILSFTEEMFINDDLGVLIDFLPKSGGAAKRLESKLVYDRLQASTLMNDGSALFHANHTNLGTAGAISETTFDELYQKLKGQKTLDATDFLDLQPAYLICGVANETSARKFLATIVPNQSSSVNPFAGSVKLIVDPRITGKNWFIAADKSRIDSIVLYRLLGKEQPIVSTRNKWSTGAFQIKVEHAVAAQAMEYRGIAKNPYT